MMNKQEYAILVLSCDKYSDLWNPFFECFNRYWNDCPYKIYLGSNTVNYKKDGITTIYSGEDKDWSSSTKKIIEQIDEKYVWIFLEDIFITSNIDTIFVNEIFNFLKDKEANFIHETQKIPPVNDKSIFDKYPKGMPYRVNVRGFWNKEYFTKLLLEGESPWNFEIMGSYRSSYDDGFYSIKKDVITFANMVEKGKWIRKSVEWCEKEDIKLDINKREKLTSLYHVRSVLQLIYFKIIVNINWKYRIKLMNILRKLFISY